MGQAAGRQPPGSRRRPRSRSPACCGTSTWYRNGKSWASRFGRCGSGASAVRNGLVAQMDALGPRPHVVAHRAAGRRSGKPAQRGTARKHCCLPAVLLCLSTGGTGPRRGRTIRRHKGGPGRTRRTNRRLQRAHRRDRLGAQSRPSNAQPRIRAQRKWGV
jgi:hypothetical protein